MNTAPQTAADKALEERDRLYRRYRVIKKAELERLYGDQQYGAALRFFVSALRQYTIDDADSMIKFVESQSHWWLRQAPDDIRFAALQAIDYRIVRIRQRAGLAPFDDALPDDPDDVWQLCRKAIST